MIVTFVVLTALQGLIISIDEFYFHWRRGLPTWERWGHPIDSVSLMLPLGLICFTSLNELNLIFYLTMSAVSCLCITKDEWIHHQVSSAKENWLHSLLFILHPTILFAGYFVWKESSTLSAPAPAAHQVALVSFCLVAIFAAYQFIFWRYYADRFFEDRRHDRQQ